MPRLMRSKSVFVCVGKKKALLNRFAKCGQLVKSCQAVGSSHQMHTYWLENDEDYAADFERAKKLVTERMTDEVYRRGTEGVKKPVGFHQGKHMGTFIREYSDNLLMFGVKARLPEYRDSHHVDLTVKIPVDSARAQLAALVERNPTLVAIIKELMPDDEGAADIIDAEHTLLIANDTQAQRTIDNDEGGRPPKDVGDADE